MKRIYLKPNTTVESLSAECEILSASGYTINDIPTEEPQLAKPGYSGGVFWDSGDMYDTQSEYGGAVTSNYPDCLWDD